MGVPMKPSYEAQISAFVSEKGVSHDPEMQVLGPCQFWSKSRFRAISGASRYYSEFSMSPLPGQSQWGAATPPTPPRTPGFERSKNEKSKKKKTKI